MADMTMLLLLLFVLLPVVLRFCDCGPAGCSLELRLEAATSGYLQSPGYPGWYAPGTVCRWRFTTERDSNLFLECPDFDVPASGSACVDRFVTTSTGVPSEGETRCGRQPFRLRSSGPRMDVYLVADGRSWGGRFYCRITAGPADCDCGWTFRTRIVGGVETAVNQYPMMVGVVSARIGRVSCGGTLIGASYVLTAAHCLRSVEPEETGLLVGDHDTSTGRETQATRLIRVSRFLVHPEYDPKTYRNDLALLESAERIAFNRQVGPACLPFNGDNVTRVTAVGWGTLEFGGEAPERLRKVTLDVVDAGLCLRVYGPERIRSREQICTYTPGKDACQFDSGGPLLEAGPDGRLHVVGIVSHGIGCAQKDTPGVNTRVRPYIDWILENTRGETYCVK